MYRYTRTTYHGINKSFSNSIDKLYTIAIFNKTISMEESVEMESYWRLQRQVQNSIINDFDLEVGEI